MAQTSWPFDSIDTTETQFSQWARNIGEGVKGVPTGTDLKPYGDGTGMTVKIYAGQSMIRGHYYSSTATETLAVTAAHATLPRIDSVVLELDPTANTILLKMVNGTAAASPVAPTLTQTDSGVYQQLLGYVYVGAAVSSISAGNVTDARVFISSYVIYNLPLVSPREQTTVTATAATGTIAFDVLTQSDLYYSSNASGNFVLNVRGSAIATFNNTVAVGESNTVVFRATNGATPYYLTAVQIDGVAQTVKWQGGVAPSSGNANSVDVYSLVITKTGASTYVVLGNFVRFA